MTSNEEYVEEPIKSKPVLEQQDEQSQNIWSMLRKSLLILFSASILFVALINSITYQLQRFWGASGSFWQTQWDKVLLLFGSVILGYVVFWSVGLIYTVMDLTGRPKFLRRYKIQPGANEPVNLKHLFKVILVVHFNQLIVSMLAAVMCYSIFDLRGYDLSRTLPTFHWVVFELVIFILVEEVVFYYSHRLAHHKLLYKYIHKLHHEWQAPVAITAIYAHPIEHLFCNLLPIFAGPLLMGCHVATSWLWYCLAILSTLNAHSGYHLPFFPSPEAHDFHHLKFNQCFGVLGLLDFLHGTDAQFRTTHNFPRHIMMLSFRAPRTQFPDVQSSPKAQDKPTDVKCLL